MLKAEHRRMERLVALKILSPEVTKNPEAVLRFQREVKAAAKLEHLNIVAAHDADEANGTHFLVMQYVEGTDLAALVTRRGRCPAKAVSCVLQAARGWRTRISAASSIATSNRRICCSTGRGQSRILDMGLARLESDGAEPTQLTETGRIMGTVDFMAPEQAMDSSTVNARADIYSLGVTLWYLLTGRAMYQAETVVKRLMAHQNNPVPSLCSACPEASPELDAIFAKMVAKTPEARYQSATEAIVDLERYLDSADSGASLAALPGEDIRFSEFLGERVPAGGPAVTKLIQNKKNADSPAPMATMLSKDGNVDTDPEMQQPIVEPPGQQPTPRRQPGPVWGRRRNAWITGGATAILTLLFGFAFLSRTDEGVIRVEIDDPQIQVRVQGTGIVLTQADRAKNITLAPARKRLLSREAVSNSRPTSSSSNRDTTPPSG